MPPLLLHTWWTVGCARDTRYHRSRGLGCPVGPLATGDTLAGVVAKWNARANTKVRV
jgi:hypothetical protein